MKSPKYGFQSAEEGKGAIGCIFSIVLLLIVIFLAFKLVPVYFNYYEFKGAFQQTVSRAGARSVQDELIVKDLISIAERNNIVLKKENVHIRRFAGQLYIDVEYSVPVNFLVLKRDLKFKIEETSFYIG